MPAETGGPLAQCGIRHYPCRGVAPGQIISRTINKILDGLRTLISLRRRKCQSVFLRKPAPIWQVSVQCLFLQHTSSAETECLKMSCSCVFVSSTMEYLSNERTLPET